MSDKTDEADLLNEITSAVRAADIDFERVGGSSRHWVRDCFMPQLRNRGLRVTKTDVSKITAIQAIKSYQEQLDPDGVMVGASRQALEEVLQDYDRLTAELEQMRVAFSHYHVNNGTDDSCKKCGLDLRNDIHKREKI